jgi:hypothetical protein
MSSHAWKAFGLFRPFGVGWKGGPVEWACEVWQSAYGHKARKRTWLYYCGKRPAELKWERHDGEYQIGQCTSRGKEYNKPTLSGKAASATPIAFRDALISLAEGCNA